MNALRKTFVLTTVLFASPCALAFNVPTAKRSTDFRLQAVANDGTQVSGDVGATMDRRRAFSQAAALASVASFFPRKVWADDAAAMGTDPDHPIVVIGAGGRVGGQVADILAKDKSLHTRAVTRSGRSTLSSSYATFSPGDVTQYESIKSAIAGASGVVFAASQSKKGGDAAHVDYLGVYNTAKACLELGVPKLAVISSGAVTRPDSVGFKATNLFVGNNIMNYKIAGENAMRDLYSASSNSPPLAYTVIRPGGLSDQASKGATGVNVCQGDVLSAEVSRQDVAQVTVAALLAGKRTDFVTMEVNGSAGETMFGQKTGPAKLSKDLPDVPTQLVHSADTYGGLLDGLLTDAEMSKSMKGVISDFRGDNVVSIESLL